MKSEIGDCKIGVLSSDMANAIVLAQKPCSGVLAAGLWTLVRDGVCSGILVTGCFVASEVFL